MTTEPSLPIRCPLCGMSGVRKRDTVSNTESNWYECQSHEYVTDERPRWAPDAERFRQSKACAHIERLRVALLNANHLIDQVGGCDCSACWVLRDTLKEVSA